MFVLTASQDNEAILVEGFDTNITRIVKGVSILKVLEMSKNVSILFSVTKVLLTLKPPDHSGNY